MGPSYPSPCSPGTWCGNFAVHGVDGARPCPSKRKTLAGHARNIWNGSFRAIRTRRCTGWLGISDQRNPALRVNGLRPVASVSATPEYRHPVALTGAATALRPAVRSRSRRPTGGGAWPNLPTTTPAHIQEPSKRITSNGLRRRVRPRQSSTSAIPSLCPLLARHVSVRKTGP